VDSNSKTLYRRIYVVVLLVVLGLLTLPLVAFVLDVVNENLIAPVHVALMLLAGIVLWTKLPGVSTSTNTSRRIAMGAAVGFLGALIAYVVFFFLLSGFGGA
jgi:hypothetical protein